MLAIPPQRPFRVPRLTQKNRLVAEIPEHRPAPLPQPAGQRQIRQLQIRRLAQILRLVHNQCVKPGPRMPQGPPRVLGINLLIQLPLRNAPVAASDDALKIPPLRAADNQRTHHPVPKRPGCDRPAGALRLLRQPMPQQPVVADQRRPMPRRCRPPRALHRQHRLPRAGRAPKQTPVVVPHQIQRRILLLGQPYQLLVNNIQLRPHRRHQLQRKIRRQIPPQPIHRPRRRQPPAPSPRPPAAWPPTIDSPEPQRRRQQQLPQRPARCQIRIVNHRPRWTPHRIRPVRIRKNHRAVHLHPANIRLRPELPFQLPLQRIHRLLRLPRRRLHRFPRRLRVPLPAPNVKSAALNLHAQQPAVGD